VGRKPLYISTGRGVTDPLTGARFSVTHSDPIRFKLEETVLPVPTKDFDAPTNISAIIHHDYDESKQVIHNKDNHPPKSINEPNAAELKRLDSKPHQA
jgi:hypothetical protein